MTASGTGTGTTRVRLQPATVYGFAVEPHDAPITL